MLRPDEAESLLVERVARQFGLQPTDLLQFRIIRKGIDARKKPRVMLVYTVSFSVRNEADFLRKHAVTPQLEQLAPAAAPVFSACNKREPVVVVGMGPAGLFCALRLAAYGIPVTLLERGKAVEERVQDVARFWREGALDAESNVQFGEGGAGTFSDGKLTCRLRDPNTAWVLEQLIRFGAPEEIRYLAKPHVGTDRLRSVVAAIRAGLQEQGCSVRFSAKLTDVVEHNGSVSGIRYNQHDELACRHLVLAIGHSARDTYALLQPRLVMEQKPFAIGLRVEHPQPLIDHIQYGQSHPALPKADYALTYNNETSGRSCYSFCMCPGGVVIGGSSEPEMVVTNGMSNLGRDSGLANSALVVNVRPQDFSGSDPLAGVRFQQHWERLAFAAGEGGYRAPAQNLLQFLGLAKAGNYRSSYQPGTVAADLTTVLPSYVSSTLREGIKAFERKMKGFVTAEATLTGVETRTSAPLRILRGDDCQSPTLAGVYPCGEGAGYAGGIMSAALDGVRVADKIAEQLQ